MTRIQLIGVQNLRVDVEAMQWCGSLESAQAIADWVGRRSGESVQGAHYRASLHAPPTLDLRIEGEELSPRRGDWVVGLPGDRYLVVDDTEYRECWANLRPIVVELSEKRAREIGSSSV